MGQYMTNELDVNNTMENKALDINNSAPLSVSGLLFIYINSFNNNEAISCNGPVRRSGGLAVPQLAPPVDSYSFKN